MRKHGIDFADVKKVFENENFTVVDDRFDYDEIRYATVGFINERVISVVYTETDDVKRIISARKATKNEQRKFIEGIRNRLGEA